MVVALTIGALLLLFSTAFRREWMNPGELTNAHATSAAKCSDCHSVDLKNHASIAGFEKRALADSALCLNCHSLGDHPLNPHGVVPASLAALDQKLQRNPGSAKGPVLLQVSRSVSGLDAHSGEMACSTCHQEHHGRTFDLKRLSNAQCQTCHSVQFASFENGHPQFSDYPYRRRTQIFFDHNSHLQKHFAEMKEKAPGSCQVCHAPDPSGRFMQVKNFEVTCAGCHGSQIRGEGMTTKGIAFFTVPGLDIETLVAKGISIGQWPKFADGKITPFMELLLNREPITRKAWQELQGIDLLDLSKAGSGQIAAAEQLAWGVKSLLFNLIVEGQGYLLEQIKSQMARTDQPALAGLAGEISPAVLLAAQKDWMPDLLTEVPNFRKGIKPPLPKRPEPTPRPSPVSSPAKSGGGDESLLGGESLASGGDLLAASPAPSKSGSKDEDLAGGDLLEPAAAAKATPSPAGTPPPIEPKQAEEWAAAGGWYRPRDSFTIFYRPSGHADAFVVAWLTAAAQLDRTTPEVFQKLADPQTPGVCMKCHTADRSEEAIMVNWLPAHPEPNAHSFTIFKHTSHFSLLGDKGCQTCHGLNPNSGYQKYFTGGSGAPRNPRQFESNFKPMSKAVCAECHRPRVAGDRCLLCHQYHTGTFAEKLVGGAKIESVSIKSK